MGHNEHESHGEEHSEGVCLSAEVAKISGIVTELAEARPLADIILAPGWVDYDPTSLAQVGVPLAGRVSKVHVQIGDTVKAGDVLVELLSQDWIKAQSDLLIKKAVASAAAVTLKLAEGSSARAVNAGDGLAGAERIRRDGEVEQAIAAKRVADAEYKAAFDTIHLLGGDPEALVGRPESGLEPAISASLLLRAPQAGVVIESVAVTGKQVDADSPLVTTGDPRKLWVTANIPETLLSKTTVESSVEIHAFSGDHMGVGIITHVTPDIDIHTRSGRARIPVRGSSMLRPGMYVQVLITPKEAAENPRLVAVPEAAVVVFEGKKTVFVVETDGDSICFLARSVMVGPVRGGFIPILKGLDAGERVVIQGAFLLKADLGKEGAEHVH